MTVPHRLYVGTIGEGLWRSSDGGVKFVRASEGMFVECHVRALAVHPHNPRILYLGNEQGLFRSGDGAENWRRVDSPLDGQQIWSILLLPADPRVMLIGTCPPRLYRTGDGGQTWSKPDVPFVQECPRIMWNRVTTLAADPTNLDTVWCGVEIDGLWVSGDRGVTWEPRGAGLSSRDIHALAIVNSPSPLGGEGSGVRGRLLASTNNDLNVSTDDGRTWQPLQIDQMLPWKYCRGLAQKCGRPEVVLMGNGDSPPGSAGIVARSGDAGQTWSSASMPARANSTIWNFAVHPADPELIYASSVAGEVYRSTDGGTSWTKLEREFGEIRALAWAP
jgi:photosystem II stability/assembly factor-like uncharacterized protein